MVPYLGFLCDSSNKSFRLIEKKKEKFLSLLREVLGKKFVNLLELQRLVGKCVSFSRAVPGALLFTRVMNTAISRAIRTSKPVPVSGELRAEFSHWLFLESWNDSMPWREERHVQVSVVSDASNIGWGGLISSQEVPSVSGYWSQTEQDLVIATKEAIALHKVLLSFAPILRNARVDALVDNQAVVNAWSNHSARSLPLLGAIKQIFFTTMSLNVYLHVAYIPSESNAADVLSRRLSRSDSTLHESIWSVVQRDFGGLSGHTCDLMALDSNAMQDLNGNILPHFTPYPSPNTSGVNLFAQDLSSSAPFLDKCYAFPPLALIGPVLCYVASYNKPFTLVVFDVYPRRFWWPMILKHSFHSLKLASQGQRNILLQPSKDGWIPYQKLPFDLWAFDIQF